VNGTAVQAVVLPDGEDMSFGKTKGTLGPAAKRSRSVSGSVPANTTARKVPFDLASM
jgi:hypothetical protein